MQLQCPCCGEQFPIEAGFADADGKKLAAMLAGLDPKLGRAVLNYLRLFSLGLINEEEAERRIAAARGNA